MRLGDVVHGLAFPRVSDGYVPVLANGFDLYLEGREGNYCFNLRPDTKRRTRASILQEGNKVRHKSRKFSALSSTKTRDICNQVNEHSCARTTTKLVPRLGGVIRSPCKASATLPSSAKERQQFRCMVDVSIMHSMSLWPLPFGTSIELSTCKTKGLHARHLFAHAAFARRS